MGSQESVQSKVSSVGWSRQWSRFSGILWVPQLLLIRFTWLRSYACAGNWGKYHLPRLSMAYLKQCRVSPRHFTGCRAKLCCEWARGDREYWCYVLCTQNCVLLARRMLSASRVASQYREHTHAHSSPSGNPSQAAQTVDGDTISGTTSELGIDAVLRGLVLNSTTRRLAPVAVMLCAWQNQFASTIDRWRKVSSYELVTNYWDRRRL